MSAPTPLAQAASGPITRLANAWQARNPRERTLLINGVSKAYAMTGWRIGFAAAGREIVQPRYNFITGLREWHEVPLAVTKDQPVIVEGIHGLNEQLSAAVPRQQKYKIYVSALTQLNIDGHNRIPTTDARLIRRLVRDYQFRGAHALKTFKQWPDVRAGEEKNIFPFQEEADVMFNSSLLYELAVLKQYVEPLLFGVEKDSPEYLEAKRLLKFFDYFIGIGSDYVPANSLLREFIGGGCFPV